MIGNKGKGKVWLIATSQQDLEKVVDRTNFQPALVGRLNARFELKPQLISDEIARVVSERILKKHPAQEASLRDLYRRHEGYLGQLADLKASRHLGTINERAFIDAYPFLPHLETLSVPYCQLKCVLAPVWLAASRAIPFQIESGKATWRQRGRP
jgi:hypothetical protein